jgi:hypothetical protein
VTPILRPVACLGHQPRLRHGTLSRRHRLRNAAHEKVHNTL